VRGLGAGDRQAAIDQIKAATDAWFTGVDGIGELADRRWAAVEPAFLSSVTIGR
jgi:hypothetical protein